MSRSFYHRWEAQVGHAVLWHLTIFARKMSEAGAATGSSGERSTTTDELPRATTHSRSLSSRDLLYILSNPEAFGLTPMVWYAINALDAMVERHAVHTLAGRLGLSAETLKELADATGLGKRAATVTKMLKATRRRPGKLALSLERKWRGLEHFRYALRPQNPRNGSMAHNATEPRTRSEKREPPPQIPRPE